MLYEQVLVLQENWFTDGLTGRNLSCSALKCAVCAAFAHKGYP